MKKLLNNIRFLWRNKKELYNFFKKLKKNETIENYITKEKQDKELFILVNGPSLNKNLDEIIENKQYQQYDLITVNFMPNDDRFYVIRPKYLIFTDPIFYKNPGQDDKQDKRILDFYDNINKKIDWDITVFVPYIFLKDEKWRKQKFTNPHLRLIPIHKEAPSMDNLSVILFLAKRGLMGTDFGTVLDHCIYIGALMGYKVLYLFGADHTFFEGLCVNDKNQVCRKTTHFYESNPKIEPIYHTYSGKKKPYTMSFFTWEYARIFKGHDIMRSIADYLGVKVVNKTPGSMIDSYCRSIDEYSSD